MTSDFLLRLALSFLIGGLWITAASVLAERMGSKIGGVIGGLPSTVVVAFGFIGWTQGAQQLYDATTAFPLAFAVNAFYMVAFAAFSPRGLGAGIGAALTVWFLTEALILWLGVNNILVSMALWGVALVSAYLALERWLKVRSHERVRIRYTARQMLGRAAFAGGIVALAVLGSRVGGPIWGSVFAAFPALYTSTLILVSRSVSVSFARSLATPLMISSMVNVTVFVLALRLLALRLPLGWALAASYVASMISAYGTYAFIRRYVR
jgi:CubicO group peptidase (beta-lactamase class C family)